jgi:CSLREA domain-containing protein
VAAPNLIAFNDVGIITSAFARSGNTWFANAIHSNVGLGIDLSGNGVTPNDVGDSDPGPNGLQNFPELSGAQRSASGIRITGSLSASASIGDEPYQIAVYASASCDASNHGEGERFLGAQTAFLGFDTSEFNFDLATDDPLGPGTQITAVATRSITGDSSEFSPCFAATDPPPGFVVNSTADPGTGGCDAAECTLREAINAANTQVGADLISFNLPDAGPFSIAVSTANPLPTITEAVTIDGYTQIGSSPNTADLGSNAVLQIVLDIQSGAGLTICASDVAVHGMAFVGDGASSIIFGLNEQGAACPSATSGHRIQGNFFGLLPDGTLDAGSRGINLTNAQAEIGGLALQNRNLFAGGTSGLFVAGAGSSGSTIRGNSFGSDPSGSGDVGHFDMAVSIDGTASGVTVGDPAAPNVFRFSDQAIRVSGASNGNRLYANHFADQDQIAINLCPVSGCNVASDPNDTDDDDAGGNNLQNFPLLASAFANADNLSVQGTLDVPLATSNAPYTIALYENAACDSSGNGQGEIFLGAQTVNLSGTVSGENFSVTLPVTPPAPGRVVTATATDPAGNTSEFSACLDVTLPVRIFANGFEN